jgi:hypothetical protein
MKKIITTLTAVTLALGLAAAAQAQVAKTPEKPAVQSQAATPIQVTPPQSVKPVEPAAKEAMKPGESAVKDTAKPGKISDKGAMKPGEPQKTQQTVKKEAKQATKKAMGEKKAGAPLETPPAATK